MINQSQEKLLKKLVNWIVISRDMLGPIRGDEQSHKYSFSHLKTKIIHFDQELIVLIEEGYIKQFEYFGETRYEVTKAALNLIF